MTVRTVCEFICVDRVTYVYICVCSRNDIMVTPGTCVLASIYVPGNKGHFLCINIFTKFCFV